VRRLVRISPPNLLITIVLATIAITIVAVIVSVSLLVGPNAHGPARILVGETVSRIATGGSEYLSLFLEVGVVGEKFARLFLLMCNIIEKRELAILGSRASVMALGRCENGSDSFTTLSKGASCNGGSSTSRSGL